MRDPNASSDSFRTRLQVLREVTEAEAAKRPKVIYVDAWKRFSGIDGSYASYVVDPRDNEGKLVRADDGFHLNVTGAEILALDVQQKIEDDLRAPAPRCNRLGLGGPEQVSLGAAAGHDRLAAGGDLLGAERRLRQASESRASISQPSVVGVDLVVGAADLAHAGLVVADDVGGELAGERDQLVVGHHVVDEAELERLVGVEEVAGEAHLARPAHADRLRQQHGQPPTRHDADAGVGVAEAGPLRRDEEVAVERQLEAAGDGRRR